MPGLGGILGGAETCGDLLLVSLTKDRVVLDVVMGVMGRLDNEGVD